MNSLKDSRLSAWVLIELIITIISVGGLSYGIYWVQEIPHSLEYEQFVMMMMWGMMIILVIRLVTLFRLFMVLKGITVSDLFEKDISELKKS
tara:strand:- start:1532 stop:1807 length:276 start_codon:yes stop_codon:yes gene_type:complete